MSYKAKRDEDGKVITGDEVIEMFMDMPGTWLVSQNPCGYQATRIDPNTVEEVKE